MALLVGLRATGSGPLKLQRNAPTSPRLLVRRQSSYASDATFSYDVQTGETLSSIADRYGVSVHELKELNYGRQAILRSSAVAPGQRVLLPARLAAVVAEHQARAATATVSVPAEPGLGAIVQEAVAAHLWILQGAGALVAGAAMIRALSQMLTQQAARVDTTLTEAKSEIKRAEASLETAEQVRQALASAAAAPVNAQAPTALKKTAAMAALPQSVASVTASSTAAVPSVVTGDAVVKAVAAGSGGGGGASGSSSPSSSSSSASSSAPTGDSSSAPQAPAGSRSSDVAPAAGAAAAVSMAAAAGRRGEDADKVVAAIVTGAVPVPEPEVIVTPPPPVSVPSPAPAAVASPEPVVAAAAVPTTSPLSQSTPVTASQQHQRPVQQNHVVPINLRASVPVAASVASSGPRERSPPPPSGSGGNSSPKGSSGGGGSAIKGGSASPRPSPAPQPSSSGSTGSGYAGFDIIATLNKAWRSSPARGATPKQQGGSGSRGGSASPPNLTSIMPSPSLAGQSLIALKSGLLDLVYGTARGVRANGEQRAGIEEHLTALEARNPNPRPTEALGALSGRWKLVYTSSTQTLLLLNALDALPLVDIGDVYQVIDTNRLVAYNKIDIAVPVLVSLTAETGFEVRTPRAFKVRFTKVGVDTYISTPQLLASLDIPPSVTVLGTTIDLAPLKRLIIDPVNAGLETAHAFLQRAVAPEFPVEVSEATSLWMLTTYLDDTLRISRDDSGHVYVMLKDTSLYRVEMEQSENHH